MKYHLYTTSRRAWTAMIKALKKAKTSIYIEMFIFLDDTYDSHDFISLLKNKAQAGVEVVIVADAFGSLDLKKNIVNDLRAAGVEVLFFSHFLRRTHRKLTIIDRRLAFLGGVNIEKKIINWLDLQIQIEARRNIRGVLRSFAYTYKMAGGKKQHILQCYRKAFFGKFKSLILENLPGHGMYSLVDYYKNKILSAQKSLQFTTPYLIPPNWFIALLDGACRRGVKIEVLIPQHTDFKILDKINCHYMDRLTNLGINFFMMKKMNHAKMLIIDGVEGVIGSQNLDVLSLNRNFEMGVFFRQKNLIKDLNKIFQTWKKQAIPFHILKIKLSWFDKIKVAGLRLFLSII